MGGNSSRALNAVTTAITAALGGQTDLQVVTNTLAPYAAQVIGKEFGHGADKNTAAQLVSHAILGATLAYINGSDPTAGGSAAVASEAAANYLTNQLAERYKDDPKYFVNGEFQANLLSETEKAQIRDLTAGIGAVIGGAAGDSSYNAQLAGVIGQNAVENNALETAWDVANLAIGTASFGYNIHEGNYGAAAIDGAGLVYDGVATAFPFLPAGASAGIKAYRGGNSLKQSINIGTDVANASKAANQAAKNVDNITKNPAVTGTKIHRETGQLLGEANGTASKLSDSASSYFKGANASTGKQPDMSWKDTGMWADLTTPKQWAVHEKKYNSNFGEGVSILYKPGQGVVKTTKLPTGAGVLITTPNNIYNNSQKEKK